MTCAEIADDGLGLATGTLTHVIVCHDSLTSLMDRGDTDDALRRLRRAKSAPRRPAP
ncbi:hypothetical protein AB0N09_06010 [Streptomyces erythrochromogenes]|uniref:hypothetical protein n=1 Tax=Streptomyces erythrochromogenes TaxID=285574 RepID=UPI00343DC785